MSIVLVPATPTADPSGRTWSDAAFATTAARVPIGLVVLSSLLVGNDLLGSAALVLFVSLDVIDGIVARAGNIDDAYRRGLDSLIDRSVVVAFFLEAALRTSSFWPAASIIALVNLGVLPFALTSWHRYRIVLKAPAWHRIWSITLFLSGLLFFARNMEIALVATAVGAFFIGLCSVDLACSHFTLGRVRGILGSD